MPTRKRHTRSHMIDNLTIILLLLRFPSFPLPVPKRKEHGPDIPRNQDKHCTAEDDNAHVLTASQSNTLRLTCLMNNFASNVMQKCGNSEGDQKASYCQLTQMECHRLEPSMFTNLNLITSWFHLPSSFIFVTNILGGKTYWPKWTTLQSSTCYRKPWNNLFALFSGCPTQKAIGFGNMILTSVTSPKHVTLTLTLTYVTII